MRVWITRSEPGASRLAAILKEHGYDPVVAPVTGIERLQVPREVTASLCVVLSEHAAWAAEYVESGHGFLAIGTQTAEALSAAGHGQVEVPEVQNSAGLVRMLQDLLPRVSGGLVVVLTGEGGTGQVQQFLEDAGVGRLRIDAYRRTRLSVTRSVTGVRAIVISSGEALASVKDLLVATGGSMDTPLLVPSARVEDLARKSGFSKIHVTDGASPDAVIAGLSLLSAQIG